MQKLYTASELAKLDSRISPAWLYKHCVPIPSHNTNLKTYNQYSLAHIRSVVSRKRETLLNHRSLAKSKREEALNTLERIEVALNKIEALEQPKSA